MKKLLILIIMTLLLISSVSATREFITQEQLTQYTDLQIKNYLINNFEFTRINDNYKDKITFYFKTNSIRPVGDKYLKYEITGKASLNRDIWLKCLDDYNFNVCKTHLITNYGKEETTGQITIYQQVRNKLINEFNRITYYRDLTKIDTTLGDVSLE